MMKDYEKTGQKQYSPKPADAKNASDGANGASRGGTTRSFGEGMSGNNFPRPAAQNNATNGQTDGHNMGRPGQIQSYPNKAVKGAGGSAYCGKASEAKDASAGEGPNSKGGTKRTYPK